MQALTRVLSLFVIVLALAVSSPALAADKVTLRMATLAPPGSAWAKILQRSAKKVEKATEGRVKFKYYFAGMQGDERDVVRKMKLGQLEGAAVTAVGLGLIKSDVRVLELPFLFKTDQELDHVRDKMAPEFEKQFKDAGYILVAWGDVGWVHLYSNSPVKAKADLQEMKMWAWTDDPIIRALFKRLGVNGVPLGVPDVLPSLQTGLINACYGPPLAAVALQWYTKVKYATSEPVSYSIGALLIRKDVFQKLTPGDQKILMDEGRATGAELMKIVRKDNERAKRAMKAQGIQWIDVPAAMKKEWEGSAQKVWKELAGKVYSQALLDQILKYRDEVR